MIDHQESVFVNCVMHNVFKFMIIDSLWHLWVWLKAKVELRLCRLSMRRSQAMRWSQAMIDSNTTVTWQQHWFCVHVGEQHPSQLCICWWNSMYQTQTPTTQHWSWFKLYEQPPTLPLDVLCASVPISRKWWPSGKHHCQEELWISMAHTQRSRSPSKHSHHLHEWLNRLQPHVSTLPKSNLGGLWTLSPMNISSQCEYRHYPNIHFQHQNQ